MAIAEPPSLDDIAPLPESEKQPEPQLDADGNPIVKRGRGRPKGSKNKTYAGRPVGVRRGSSLEKEIGGLIVTINLPLQMIPATQKGALDVQEITALSKAIDAECQNNPTFRKYVESALRVQGSTSLIAVIAMISARRVIRYDLLPVEIPEEIGGKEGVDLLIGHAIAATNNLSVFKTPPPPVETTAEV